MSEIKKERFFKSIHGHDVYGIIMNNPATINACIVVSVIKGRQLLSCEYGGCLCQACIVCETPKVHSEVVKYIEGIVREKRLNLTETMGELYLPAAWEASQERGWWRSQGIIPRQ